MNIFQKSLLFIFATVFSSCYSFRGISIPPEVYTFSVNNFDDRSTSVVPGLAQDFTQELKDKIRNESRLKEESNIPADIEFSGSITDFRVTALAPQPGETTALSQLKIYIKVSTKYREEKFEENEFTQTFSLGVEYSSDQNLLDIQEELVDQIFSQIVEDVFNKAFTNW